MPNSSTYPTDGRGLTKPFVLLATRTDDVAADAEYASFLAAGGLAPHELRRVRLEATPMPDFDLAEISGFIVGGSPFCFSDAEKSATQQRVEAEFATLLTRLYAADFPFLGACYGIGTLGAFIGAQIGTRVGEAVSAPEMTITAAGLADPLLAGLPNPFRAYVAHKEGCEVLPATATLLVTTPGCQVQMMRVRQNLYATQFHAELDGENLAQRLARYRGHGYFTDDELDTLQAQVRAQDAKDSMRIVRNFVDRYGR
ncbi:glutamine amidotransferase [Buchananella hordeovulneris]|uniref:glutamine amidotransferase n=1 Tax=Buchananella hordeovulneris TaxID=52770 RepID=UPI000F5DF6D3|nr:glutamine amidotransferase [Buchananella hordeovulneris]RRD42880.1 glutamine amidotransferase [Buchananella hordeovulneris]